MRGFGPTSTLCLTCLMFGCSSDDELAKEMVAGGIVPLPLEGCENESYTGCDVETEACQAAVFSTMACLRGNPTAPRPASRTLTATEFTNELLVSLAEKDAALTQAYEDCMVLLKLAAAGDLSVASRVALNTSTVPAYYDSKTKQITFVVPDDRPLAAQKESAYIMLAHEYVHALQDFEHDLGQLTIDYAKTTDARLAVTSLIEGEAEAHADEFMAASFGLDATALDWDARYAALKAYYARALVGYPPILAIWRNFPYAAGGVYVRQVIESGGMPAVRALYHHPPQATLTVTSGLQPIGVDVAPPLAPDGYELSVADTLGSELLYASFSRIAGLSSADANGMAADWRGDRVSFYRNPTTGYVAVLWRIRFATEASKASVLNATLAWQSAAVDGDVILGLSTDPNRVSVLAKLLDNAKNGVTVPSSDATDGSTQAAQLQRLLELR